MKAVEGKHTLDLMLRGSLLMLRRGVGDVTIGKALDAYYNTVVVARQANNVAEVSTLLTCLRLDGKGADKKRITAASLIASTAFHPSTIREATTDSNLLPDSKVHNPGCPFFVERVPLYALYQHQGFLKAPCTACATKRLHFLASEDFSTDFAKRSVRLPSRQQSSSLSASAPQPSPALEAAILDSFQSMEGFVQALTDHCTSRRGSGFTWIAWCNATGKVVVVNMPRNASPTTVGLWPLAAFNLTETAIGDVFHAVQASAMEAPKGSTIVHPEWSRAARNPNAAVTRDANIDAGSTSMQEMVLRIAQYYVAHLDWASVEGALDAARTYYASPTRAEKQKQHADGLADIAKKRALSAWSDAHDDEAVVPPTTASAPNTSTPTPAVSKETSEPQASGVGVLMENDTNAREQEAPSATAEEEHEGSASDEAAVAAEYTVSVSDDGVQTFAYHDGRRTVVDPTAGTTTFYTDERVTTTYADGSSHFAFADGRELWTDKKGEVYTARPPSP